MPGVGPRGMTELSRRLNAPLCLLLLSPVPSLRRPASLQKHTEPLEDLTGFHRCCFRVRWLPQLVAIDAEPAHEIVQGRRLGKADRATDEPLHPRPQMEVFPLDLLRLGLAHLVRPGVNMALVGTPLIGGEAVEANRLEQRFELYQNGLLPPAKAVRHPGPTGVIDGLPQPPRPCFLADLTPHFIEF